jgi:hypothetical protein
MNFNVLTTVLTTIVGALGRAQSGMGKAGAIMTGLAVIEIVLAALWIAMDGGSLSEGFKKLLQLSFWVWFATHFAGFAKYFCDSLVQMALGEGVVPAPVEIEVAVQVAPREFSGLRRQGAADEEDCQEGTEENRAECWSAAAAAARDRATRPT